MSRRAEEIRATERVMVQRFDHLTLCVANLEEAIDYYSALFGTEFYSVAPLGLREFGVGRAALCAADIELVEPESPQSEAAKFIEGRKFMREGEAILGMAFKVQDLEQATAAMRAHDVNLLAQAEGSGRKVATFRPEDTFGAMVKLVEYIPFPSRRDVGIGTLWRMARGLPAVPERATGRPTMRIQKIDHFIISVNDRDKAVKFFEDLFGTKHFDLTFLEPTRFAMAERFPSQPGASPPRALGPIDVDVDDVHLEIVEVPGRREGLVSIAYLVSNFEEACAAMEAVGMRLTQRIEWPNRRVAGFSPGAVPALIAEIHEYRPLVHRIVAMEMAEDLAKERGH